MGIRACGRVPAAVAVPVKIGLGLAILVNSLIRLGLGFGLGLQSCTVASHPVTVLGVLGVVSIIVGRVHKVGRVLS